MNATAAAADIRELQAENEELREKACRNEEQVARLAKENAARKKENAELKAKVQSNTADLKKANQAKRLKEKREKKKKAEMHDDTAEKGDVWTAPAYKFRAKEAVLAALTLACADSAKIGEDGAAGDVEYDGAAGDVEYVASKRKARDIVLMLMEDFLRPKNGEVV